jgi:hypothetical protein
VILQIRFSEINLPLWEEVGALIVRYRGRFPRKSVKQLKQDRIDRLNAVISEKWKTAEKLAEEAGLTYHAAVKLLLPMVKNGEIQIKEFRWVDHRFRCRQIWLYSKPEHTDFINIYNSIFGCKVPSHTGKATVHRLGDDE